MPRRSHHVTTFVKLDTYETAAVRQIQTLMMKHMETKLHTAELLRASLRFFVHQVLPEDFVLGEDINDVLSRGGVLQEIWQLAALRDAERRPEDPRSSSPSEA